MTWDEPAYVKDTGTYTLLVNVGYDFTGYSACSVRITDPSGITATVSATPYQSDPTTKLLQCSISATETDELGRWRVVGVVDGKYSEPAGSYRVVEEAING